MLASLDVVFVVHIQYLQSYRRLADTEIKFHGNKVWQIAISKGPPKMQTIEEVYSHFNPLVAQAALRIYSENILYLEVFRFLAQTHHITIQRQNLRIM